MKEICRNGPVFSGIRMPEVRGGVRLVRALVFRKPYVAIDTHHGAAIGTRIGDESDTDPLERRREVSDQTQERRLDIGLVALLVRLEPRALVVSLEIPEKAEQTWPEITVRCPRRLVHGAPPRHREEHQAMPCSRTCSRKMRETMRRIDYFFRRCGFIGAALRRDDGSLCHPPMVSTVSFAASRMLLESSSLRNARATTMAPTHRLAIASARVRSARPFRFSPSSKSPAILLNTFSNASRTRASSLRATSLGSASIGQARSRSSMCCCERYASMIWRATSRA